MELRACLAQKSPWNSSAIVLVGFANRSVYSSSCSSNGITCVNGAYCINQSWHFGRVLLFVSVCWTSELWNKNLRIDDSINLCHSFFFFWESTYAILKTEFHYILWSTFVLPKKIHKKRKIGLLIKWGLIGNFPLSMFSCWQFNACIMHISYMCRNSKLDHNFKVFRMIKISKHQLLSLLGNSYSFKSVLTSLSISFLRYLIIFWEGGF